MLHKVHLLCELGTWDHWNNVRELNAHAPAQLTTIASEANTGCANREDGASIKGEERVLAIGLRTRVNKDEKMPEAPTCSQCAQTPSSQYNNP